MDKKSSIAGLILVALIFIGFSIYTTHQQKEYQRKLSEYKAYVAANSATQMPAVQEHEGTSGVMSAEERESAERVARFGETLAAARDGEQQLLTVENDYLSLTFSTLGGQIVNAELKDYTKFAPRGERCEPVRLFDPSTAHFDMSFFVKNGTRDVQVKTSEYYFELSGVERTEGMQRVKMTLPVAEDARFVYEYTVYDSADASRDYMVDLAVRLENMAPYMTRQTRIDIDWSNTSYQNERGFKNENMYTTAAYRLPGDRSISELSMGDGTKKEEVNASVNWVAFKQQFFSSVFIARGNMTHADLSYSTLEPGTGFIKSYSAQMSVPYDTQTEAYDFAFYLGPNKYAILKNIKDADGGSMALERLIPLGWGIFGWVNRWFTIPVFDFLRKYIASFGIIILILAVLVKVIISPLTYKSYLSTAKMRVIKPEMDAINAKYPNQDDAMKKQQAMMELYKKAGINPMGGCIPMLIQMPIIIAMFRFFPASIELREQAFLWSDDLSSYDSVLNLPFTIPFYGNHVSLFALLMALVFFLYSYINYKQTASSQPQMFGMKFMMVYMMPAMMLFWFNDYSSGLSYYSFLTPILSMIQTFAIRYMVDDNKIHAMIQANAAKKSKGKKSRFQQRYEEQLRLYQEQMKKNQKRK